MVPHPQLSKRPSSVAAPRSTPDSNDYASASQSISQPQTQKSFWSTGGVKSIAMGLGGFLLALMTWEAILQLSVESRRGASEHPALGRIENPGFMLHTKEGFGRTRLNSLGMRAPEPTPKQADDYRILILGDSFTRGDEVADGLNFSDRLQAWFAKVHDADDPSASPTPRSQHPIQVINAGKPSASPAGYLYAANFHRETFAPDSTVIQLTESDFTGDMSSSASEFYASQLENQQGYEVLRNENFGSVDPLAQTLMQYVAPLQSIMQMSVLRVGGRNVQASLTSPESDEMSPSEAEQFLKPQPEDTDLVRWTVEQLNEQFPNLVIVFIPAMNYKDAGEVSSNERNAGLEAALLASTQQQDVPFINMRADFLAHYRSQGTHLKGFSNTLPGEGHLNPLGHELVARRLIEFYRDGETRSAL